MIQMCHDGYPKSSFKKLHAGAIGPLCILHRFGLNACLLDLPADTNISLIFSVEDLRLSRQLRSS